jgi:hypothetical protein
MRSIEALPGPYAVASTDGTPTPVTLNLVRAQVRALLEASPAFRTLTPNQRREIAANMVKIGAYTASLVQEEWQQAKKIGQTPVLRQESVLPQLPRTRSVATAQERNQNVAEKPADEFNPRAANNVARITQQTLNAIAFPTFVADLIKGTYNAVITASIQQMEAYGQLLANVAKTVDQFMADNITDNQARDYLAQMYPGHFKVEVGENNAKLSMRQGADDLPKPSFQSDLGVEEGFTPDDDSVEEVLVPAARRRLAQQRHQLLSTMVLMGINRIVVTSGKIRAQMGFHIDAHDHGTAASASQFDWQNETVASAGFLFGGVATRNSITYVSTTKRESSDSLNVNADLTGEVELKFKSDYFPLERFANTQAISLIQNNTPNPAANAPSGTGAKSAPSNGAPAAVG